MYFTLMIIIFTTYQHHHLRFLKGNFSHFFCSLSHDTKMFKKIFLYVMVNRKYNEIKTFMCISFHLFSVLLFFEKYFQACMPKGSNSTSKKKGWKLIFLSKFHEFYKIHKKKIHDCCCVKREGVRKKHQKE